MIENQFRTRVKVVRIDNEGEFVNHEFVKCLANLGIVYHRTCPYTPQQNGVAERKHKYLLDIARALRI